MADLRDPKDVYERGRVEHGLIVARMEARARGLGGARLGVAAAALVVVGGLIWAHLGVWAWGGLLALFAIFAVLVVVHSAADKAKERAAAAFRFNVRGLARLALAWDELPPASEKLRSPDEHPYAGDLDIFGRASLMQAVDATETALGERMLASLLTLEAPSGSPGDPAARQAAVADLAGRTGFREHLAATAFVADGQKASPADLLAWAESKTHPGQLAELGLVVISWMVPAIVAAVFAFSWTGRVTATQATFVGLGAIALSTFVSAPLAASLQAVSAKESAVTRWRSTIAALERERFEAPLLRALRERLVGSGRLASREMASLERIVSFVDARQNELFRFVIGPLMMWDVHCARALRRWRARSGARLRGWLDALAEVEALASLGAFAFEHPDFAWPEFANEPGIVARSLGHPLIIASRRVGNDVTLASTGRALVVTGSNMSGKSTLLRAIGTNAVLAFAGAPVCAAAMTIGRVRVATSMRVEDSLAGGVSHFYAEIARLKRILDLAGEPGRPPVLFLLDEILHGTNSRERIIGARAVVRQLLAKKALGAVSTHDLGITDLAAELGGRVENVHFEEQVVGRAMTFDYVLRPGIVQSSNALRLMRAIGIDVDESQPADHGLRSPQT